MRIRRILLAALLCAIPLTLAACGGDDDGGAAASTAPATRTVTDTLLGDVEGVPAKPERVIALWRTGSELADIGVVPVGQLDGELAEEELGPEVYATVKDVPVVGTYEGVDVEKVIALEPDLIIGMDNGGLSIDYEELSAVAPTVILKIAEPTDVWDNYPRVADLVGRSTDFEERDAKVEADLAAIADEHGDTLKGLQVTSFGAVDGSIWVDTSKSLTYRRLAAAGFGYNPRYTKNPDRYVEELATENIADLADQDVIFYDTNLDGTPVAGVREILEMPSFTRLPAAKAGRVYPLTSGTIYTFAAAEKQVADLRAAAEDLSR